VRGERLYRTGDLGCYRPDGSIQIHGRADFQLKVNGYRIEAGEVETRLVSLDAVRQAVVVSQEGTHGDRLTAHLVPAGATRPADDELHQALRTHLPDYMIPAKIVWHESLPLTKNGKVDRVTLMAGPTIVDKPEPRGEHSVATSENVATSEVERTLAELWESVLLIRPVDLEARLYDLGGDSIAAARIIVGARKLFGVSLPFHELREVDTVRAMAARISAMRAQNLQAG
jgi:pyochelin synthetase